MGLDKGCKKVFNSIMNRKYRFARMGDSRRNPGVLGYIHSRLFGRKDNKPFSALTSDEEQVARKARDEFEKLKEKGLHIPIMMM